MTEIKVDNIVNVAGTGKPNFPVAPTHSSGSALSTINTYQYETATRVVTVVSDGGNKYAIDGVTTPTITLLRGVTYTFDVSDSSNSNHPLAFKNAGTSYTTGITSSGTAGTAGATVTFAVAADAPLTGLTYYCTVHGDGMGSSVTTSDPKNGAMLWDGQVKFYLDSQFKAVGTSGGSGGGGGSSSGSFPSNFDISNLSYDNVTTGSLSGASYGSALSDPGVFEFNNDGTKIYLIDWNNTPAQVHEYPLSTAYDISTVGSVTYSLNISAQSTSPFGLTFKPDGTVMYLGDSGTDNIYQFALSTAWDLSTATYDNKYGGTQTTGSLAFKIKSDGTKLISLESQLDSLHGYSMSTAWDISTLSYDSERVTFNSAQSTGPSLPLIANLFTSALGLTINPAGDIIFITHYSPTADRGTIYQIDLSTAWDITTASYNNKSFDMGSQESGMCHFEFNGDFTKIIAVGRTGNALYQYSYNSGSSSSGIAWGGARGFRLGGNLGSGNVRSNVIDYWSIDTPGNAQDFGDLTKDKYWGASTSNGTRVITAGGYYTSNTSFLNDIDYITCATTGNAVDFGDMTYSPYGNGAVSDGTRGCLFAGYAGTTLSYRNNIEYVTIATTGNATDQADLLNSSYQMGGWSDATRGVVAGGSSPTIDVIQYFTIQSTSNAQDFGDLSATWRKLKGGGDSTRSCFMGGRITGSPNANSWTDTIEYVTTQTPGNSTDFGNLTAFGDEPATACDGTYCCVVRGEYNGNGRSNVIERFTVQTTGNATDFGDLTESQELAMGAAGNAA